MGDSAGKGGSRNSPATNEQEVSVIGNPETSGHLHEDEFSYNSDYEQRIQWLMEDYGLNKTDAESMEKALSSFTGGEYTAIRSDFTRGLTDSIYYQRALELENLIHAGPKYSGELFRGIDVSPKTASNIISTLQNGGQISMNGLSSWSSKYDVAEDFASTYSSNTNGVSIMFKLPNGTKAGTTIQHFSGFGKGEAEVLCSSRARYGANHIFKYTNDDGRTVYEVTVDEYIN